LNFYVTLFNLNESIEIKLLKTPERSGEKNVMEKKTEILTQYEQADSLTRMHLFL